MKSLGQIGYEAYAEHTGGKTFDGRDMPTWEQVQASGTKVAGAWEAAAKAIAESARETILELGRQAFAQTPSRQEVIAFIQGGEAGPSLLQQEIAAQERIRQGKRTPINNSTMRITTEERAAMAHEAGICTMVNGACVICGDTE